MIYSWEITFDALNRRVSKTVQGQKEDYLYSSLDRIAYMSGTQLKAEYVFEEGIDRPVMMKKGTDTYFIQQDILGNVVSLVGTDGKVKESIYYEIFGLPTIKDDQGNAKNNSISPFLFTGREYDSEIGIYHYRARAYSPILGRFMQLDPIDLKAGDVNPYRYVGNNPLNFRDPLGFFLANAAGAVAGGVGAAAGAAASGGSTGNIVGSGIAGAVTGGLNPVSGLSGFAAALGIAGLGGALQNIIQDFWENPPTIEIPDTDPNRYDCP